MCKMQENNNKQENKLMNKKMKVITINGVRGLFMAAFIVFGLISGFIISPGWVCMTLWNNFAVNNFAVSPMNLYQGLLMWAVIALSMYAINNKRSLIGFGSYPAKLSNEQIKEIIKKSRMSNPGIISDLENLQNAIKTENTVTAVSKDETVSPEVKETEKEEIRG